MGGIRLGIGFVGSGFITRFHIQSMVGVREADVRGVWSPTGEHAEAAAAVARSLDVGEAKAFASIEAMVADPAIDALWLCGPNHARVENVEAICRAVGDGTGALRPVPSAAGRRACRRAGSRDGLHQRQGRPRGGNQFPRQPADWDERMRGARDAGEAQLDALLKTRARELVRLDAYQAQVIQIQYASPVGLGAGGRGRDGERRDTDGREDSRVGRAS